MMDKLDLLMMNNIILYREPIPEAFYNRKEKEQFKHLMCKNLGSAL